MICQNCGTEINQDVNFCSNCGELIQTTEVEKQGMGWYNFNTYFKLPFNALIDVVVGVIFISSMLDELLLMLNPNLTFNFLKLESVITLNSAFGIVLILLAFYDAYVAISMIKFKKNAPKLFYAGLVSGEVIGLIYYMAMLFLIRGMITWDAEIITEIAKEIISSAVSIVLWLLINTKYFGNRKHLFVN